ncbi:unnamed protein product [Hanseniaspora opuntiae]
MVALVENGVDMRDENMLRRALNAYTVKMKCLSHEMIDVEPEYYMLHRNKPKINDTWKFQAGYSYSENPEEIYRVEPRFKAIRSDFRAYDFKLSLNEIGVDKFPIMGLELNKPFEKPLLMLKGGTAGLGNMHFKINGVRNPIFAKRGRQGIEASFIFELKLLADLGLVGLPNAGKSTLLGAISNAQAKSWTLGVHHVSTNIGENKGLGLEFLKHIENSSGIVFVIGMDRKDPTSDLKVLIRELNIHGIKNIERALVVCNKCDLDSDAYGVQEKFKAVEEFVANQNLQVKDMLRKRKDAPEDIDSDVFWNTIPISAKNHQNTQLLKRYMSALVFDKKTNKEEKGFGVNGHVNKITQKMCSGKTIAFAAPMLTEWSKDPCGMFGIVLTPTRELAMQIAEQFSALGSSMNIRISICVGGEDIIKQSLDLQRRPHFIIATPGRLAHHILQGNEEFVSNLKRLKYLVLDEA